MGRDRKNEASGEHFARMTREFMNTPAWRSLSSTAQALYPWLKLEWKGPRSNNNGKISLSVRQAAKRLGVTRNTAARALHDLQAKGFVVVTQKASLGIEGEGNAPRFELTEISLPHGESNQGRRLYKEWRSGKDFPVQKTSTNNPSGRNGKK